MTPSISKATKSTETLSDFYSYYYCCYCYYYLFLKRLILSCLNSYNRVLDHFWSFWLKPLYVMQLLGIIIFFQEEHSLARFEELNHAFAVVVPL